MLSVRTRTKVPIYGGQLEVLVGQDLQALLDKHKIPQQYQEYAGIIAFTMSRVATRKNGTKVMHWAVVCRPTCDMDTAAHEAVHVALSVFDDRGVDPDVENQEPLAYLVGWVAGQIEKALLKYQKTKEATANERS